MLPSSRLRRITPPSEASTISSDGEEGNRHANEGSEKSLRIGAASVCALPKTPECPRWQAESAAKNQRAADAPHTYAPVVPATPTVCSARARTGSKNRAVSRSDPFSNASAPSSFIFPLHRAPVISCRRRADELSTCSRLSRFRTPVSASKSSQPFPLVHLSHRQPRVFDAIAIVVGGTSGQELKLPCLLSAELGATAVHERRQQQDC